ncbi:GNAT family N-acetyltransferase [Oerskovia jenensis]|uniref:Ribosomal-protein-alanine N-acetyltransferase n=1 Tax=Oerskovia jenensis TaxID=162169 RepID=A0ABS2LIA0_9CELL|nr:GNAT family protein [Oerskovia jenensis]MBM7480102.1 ribosomal-protein-alanine N-acetyltransferase [Oerskovia jenensis]
MGTGTMTNKLARTWSVSKPWPVTLREDATDGSVVLRPLRRKDGHAWMTLRARNASWLERWEATSPRPGAGGGPPTFGEYVRILSAQARAGTTLPFAVELDGELVGQLTVSSITYGSLCSASIGYWVGEHVAGRGVIPTAVAMSIDYCFQVLGLHRIEINIRPENGPSLRVVEKLGLRDEGVRERYLHIQGQWCDHRTFAITTEEVPDGLLTRWQERRRDAP